MTSARQIYLGSRRGPALPYDSEVEYLQSSGTQWIDTGIIVGGPDTRWVADCAITDTRSVNRYTGQVATAPTYDARFNFGRNLNNNFSGFIGSLNYSFVEQSDSDRHTFVLDSVLGVFSVDSNVFNFSGITWLIPSQPRGGISLFGRLFIDTGDTNPIISMKVWSSQIYQSGILVSDMIPVRFTNEQGQSEGAMYDRVSGQLFRNSGTGAFLFGTDIAGGGGING